MSRTRFTGRMGKAAISLLASGAVVTGMVAVATPANAAKSEGLQLVEKAPSFKAGRYIVVLREPSAARYTGSDSRFARTAPRAGGQFDSRTPAARAYTQHLVDTHRTIARKVGASVARSYTAGVNGFAAKLSGEQVLELNTDRKVLLVEKDQRREVLTWNTPDFLGLTGKNGAWKAAGGKKDAGAGVVVGVLDTGIWPESASFAGRNLTSKPKTKYDIHRSGTSTFMDKADGTRFQGECMPGEQFTRQDCSTKLIGARYYPDIFANVSDEDASPEEYRSPRDGDGHGTHTASTAAGNSGVKAQVEGRKFGKISGMAPAARIAAYKVCFSDNDPDSGDCYTTASLAAIDDAIIDGVDVINYSISGSVDTVVDATELAFEGAAEAGIFVAASAGNSGPTASTVNHPSPWLTTVAASTHYSFENTVVLGNGKKIVGGSITQEAVPETPLVDSVEHPADGELAEDAELCAPDSLDDSVAGKIVVCTRGVYDRVAKSDEVERAGGVAMILANPSVNSIDADFHAIPTVHVPVQGATKVWNYIESAGEDATASFKLGNRTNKVTPVPQIGGFSSRGPSLASEADILKPDISAPGVSVLAAVAPPSGHGRDFDLYSGTSMASPHIAGLAALIAGERKNWSPMQIKSAMMTTSKPLLEADGSKSKDALAQGSGNVNPRKFADPGLFVTAGPDDWYGFITGQGLDTGVPAIEPGELNQPSMAESQVVSSVDFTRQFVSTRKGTWDVKFKVPGFDGDASANELVSKRSGDVEDLGFTFTRTTAPLGEFTSGAVILNGPTKIRIPVALQPVALRAPARVDGTGTTGSVTVPVTSGATGDVTVNPLGLDAGDRDENTVSTSDPVVFYDCFVVPEGTDAIRTELDSLQDDADLDLYLLAVEDGCGDVLAFAAASETGAADESFTVLDPEPGTYQIAVQVFEDGADNDGDVDYVLDNYIVGDATDEGDFTANPNPVPTVGGEETSFDAEWTGLNEDSHYFGLLTYDGSTPTSVYVDTTVPD